MTSSHLPAYSQDDIKQTLLEAGVSGTVYSLVMPESEAILSEVMDGGSQGREEGLLDLYREAWTQKQDALHETYFERWIEWSSPVVSFDASRFAFRYPTAGASEAIFKLMAEYAAQTSSFEPTIAIFDGEYEGFPAYADSLGVNVIRYARSEWREIAATVPPGAQFWISQPSAIDGMVWPHFGEFAQLLHDTNPQVELLPDLTYVGNVAREYSIALDTPNINQFLFSHSKPMGGYYHRVGGAFSTQEIPSLFGNKWFKNLLSLAWGNAMMEHFGVFDLPRKYASLQAEAARRAGALLGIEALAPADISLLAIAPTSEADPPALQSVLRGCADERVIRLCLTPSLATLIDPELGGEAAASLLARWKEAGLA